MVLRAIPVISDTAASPPQPAARVSLAAKKRRPRSSRFEPSACQRSRIASLSTMHSGRRTIQRPESLNPESIRRTSRRHPIHLFLRLS
jgi:hypothetical protein